MPSVRQLLGVEVDGSQEEENGQSETEEKETGKELDEVLEAEVTVMCPERPLFPHLPLFPWSWMGAAGAASQEKPSDKGI